MKFIYRYIFLILLIYSCREKCNKNQSSNKTKYEIQSKSIDYLDIEDSLQHIVLKSYDTSLLFDLSSSNNIRKYKITSIGNVGCLGDTRIINTISYSGLNSGAIRANSTLSFYKDNKLQGWFYIGGDEFEKIHIQNCKIFLEYKKVGVNCSELNRINLTDGIPSEIFLNCKGDLGNIYSFNRPEA
jgi:hypothetical protein